MDVVTAAVRREKWLRGEVAYRMVSVNKKGVTK
jgi:hypothetical protein